MKTIVALKSVTSTVTAVAWKLDDWMERMAAAIKEHEFDQVNLNGL